MRILRMLPHLSKCKFRFSRDRFRKVFFVLPDQKYTEIIINSVDSCGEKKTQLFRPGNACKLTMVYQVYPRKWRFTRKYQSDVSMTLTFGLRKLRKNRIQEILENQYLTHVPHPEKAP